jgi:hypothetical protein
VQLEYCKGIISVKHNAPPGKKDYSTCRCALDGKLPASTIHNATPSPLRLAECFMTDRREYNRICNCVAGGLGAARSRFAGPTVVQGASRHRLRIRTKFPPAHARRKRRRPARQRRSCVVRAAALNEVLAVGVLAAPSGGSTPASSPALRPLWAGHRIVSPLSLSQAPLTTLPSAQRRRQCRAPKRASSRRARIATAAGRRYSTLLALDGLRSDTLDTGLRPAGAAHVQPRPLAAQTLAW